MGKRSRQIEENVDKVQANGEKWKGLANDNKAVDPTLALLFASSAGPIQAPSKARYEQVLPSKARNVEGPSEDDSVEISEEDEDDLSSVDVDLDNVDLNDILEQGAELTDVSTPQIEKKRKRNADDDLEGKYLLKLAREEEKEEAERQAERRLKRQKISSEQNSEAIEADNDSEDEGDRAISEDDAEDGAIQSTTKTAPLDVPVHESLAPDRDAVELEKAARTVFLANVSTSAITSKADKKTLLTHMASFFPDLPAPLEGKPDHKVESIRFRSTAYAGTSLPKKAAFVKKELMDSTTKSTNAYVVYSTAYAAREAAKRLNGTEVLNRHLRVDSVAHPAKTDHRRCVFVGNLGFVDDESMLDQGGETERKRSKIPSDIEEGLWRQFGKAGSVESVRVVRDEKTRVGKGFAYVQFLDANSVEAALLFNEKKYPPMLPRILRVVRAKAPRKTALALASRASDPRKSAPAKKDRIYNPKMSSEISSLHGRAGKLLGRAGAAKFKKETRTGANETEIGKRGQGTKEAVGSAKGLHDVKRTPEMIVFEGYRASAKNGKPKDLKMGGKKKQGKPNGRGAKRASAWKKGSGKK